MAKSIIIDLENEGLLNREDPLSKYLPDFPRGDEITLQNLIDNRSGLPRELKGEYENILSMSPEDYIEEAKKQALEFDPGTDKRYSNVGFEILYYLIGELNKSSFPVFIEKNYFPSLKMTNSGAHFSTADRTINKWAKNHTLDGKITRVENITEEDKKQSTLFASAKDLILFLDHCNKEKYSASMANKKGVIGWTGGSEGISTHAQININSGNKFVMLANFDQIPLKDILENTEKILNGESVELPKPTNRNSIELDEQTLRKYEGRYDITEANNMILEFKFEKGHLVLYQNGNKLTKLYPESETIFYFDHKIEDSFEFVSIENDWGLLMDWKGIKLKGVKVEQ